MKKISNQQMINEMEIQMYLEGKSDNTYNRYKRILEKIEKHFEGKAISELKAGEIRKYLMEIRKSKKETTYNNYVAALRYVEKKIIGSKENIEYMLPLARLKKREVIVPTDEEVIKLIRECEDKEMKCIIELAITTGGRISEIVKIKFEDIYRTQNKLRIKGKGGKERYTEMPEEMLKELEEYYRGYRKRIDNEYMFSREKGHVKSDYVGRELKRIEKKIGLKEYTMHQLRKYFATKKYAQTRDIKYVSRILGHHDETTQRKYISENYEQYKTLTTTEIIVRAQQR